MRKEQWEKKEPLSIELVQEFVRAAHGDFAKVRELLELEPDLLHATVNWGGDDWESALGAAAHTGNREIVQWLLLKGARLDVFTAAMLGDLPLIIEILRLHPETLHAKGPHGIPLVNHARIGGEKARAVHEYLLLQLRKEVENI